MTRTNKVEDGGPVLPLSLCEPQHIDELCPPPDQKTLS